SPACRPSRSHLEPRPLAQLPARGLRSPGAVESTTRTRTRAPRHPLLLLWGRRRPNSRRGSPSRAARSSRPASRCPHVLRAHALLQVAHRPVPHDAHVAERHREVGRYLVAATLTVEGEDDDRSFAGREFLHTAAKSFKIQLRRRLEGNLGRDLVLLELLLPARLGP